MKSLIPNINNKLKQFYKSVINLIKLLLPACYYYVEPCVTRKPNLTSQLNQKKIRHLARNNPKKYVISVCLAFLFVFLIIITNIIDILEKKQVNNLRKNDTILKIRKIWRHFNKDRLYFEVTTEIKNKYLVQNRRNKTMVFKKTDKNTYHNLTIKTKIVKPITVENIYWGTLIEDLLPKGFNKIAVRDWENFTMKVEGVKLETGCGRSINNKLITFKDGRFGCVRYRENVTQIEGEIFSYYLGLLLNLNNFAPLVVKRLDLNSSLWRNTKDAIDKFQWNTNVPVLLTPYLSQLQPVVIPKLLNAVTGNLNQNDIRSFIQKEIEFDVYDHDQRPDVKLQNNTNGNIDSVEISITQKNIEDLLELAQWTDLIIFDYLIANNNRLLNVFLNAVAFGSSIEGKVFNLLKKNNTSVLLFFNNEKGLFEAYEKYHKFETYLKSMLHCICIFRKPTVDALKNLSQYHNIDQKLNEMFVKKNDPLVREFLNVFPQKNGKILEKRIRRVLNHVKNCENKYSIKA